ncbi:Hypothetical protein A7982_03511 [Minicystis rosea]|nr:Hypothetical protein A7982_03511 [Minicystis rosea]
MGPQAAPNPALDEPALITTDPHAAQHALGAIDDRFHNSSLEMARAGPRMARARPNRG